jgi:hypothetical protein
MSINKKLDNELKINRMFSNVFSNNFIKKDLINKTKEHNDITKELGFRIKPKQCDAPNISEFMKYGEYYNNGLESHEVFTSIYDENILTRKEKEALLLKRFKIEHGRIKYDYIETAKFHEKKMNETLSKTMILNGKEWHDPKFRESGEEREKAYFKKHKYEDKALLKEFNPDMFADDKSIPNRYIDFKYDLVSEFKQKGQIIRQSIITNSVMAREEGHTATFFTISLPSIFHPFRTFKGKIKLNKPQWMLNPNYGFKSVEEGYKYGSIYMNEIISEFYQGIKRNIRDSRNHTLRFNIVSEQHQSGVLHIHGILFHPAKLALDIKKQFDKVCSEYKIEQPDFQQDFDKGINGAVKYIMKYIVKSLDADIDDLWVEEHKDKVSGGLSNSEQKAIAKKNYIYAMEGWRKRIGVQIHRSSRLPISKGNYKRIYRNMDYSVKDSLLETARNDGTCLMYEVNKNTYVKKITHYGSEVTIKEINKSLTENDNTPLFKVYIEVNKTPKIRNVNSRIGKEYVTEEIEIEDYNEGMSKKVKPALSKNMKDFNKNLKLNNELTQKILEKELLQKELNSYRKEIALHNTTKTFYDEKSKKTFNTFYDLISGNTIDLPVLKSMEELITITTDLSMEIHKLDTDIGDLEFSIEKMDRNKIITMIDKKQEEIMNLRFSKLSTTYSEIELEELEFELEKYEYGLKSKIVLIDKRISEILRGGLSGILNQDILLNDLYMERKEIKREINHFSRHFFMYYKRERQIVLCSEKLIYDSIWYESLPTEEEFLTKNFF